MRLQFRKKQTPSTPSSFPSYGYRGKPNRSRWIQRLVTIVPLLLVNGVALTGQFGWSREHLASWHTPGQVAFALALESIAVFLAYHGFLSEKSNDSALRLKLASYGFGLGVGALNYSHYSPEWKPTAVAIVVGSMSASSPWLWAIYSRRVSRDDLIAQKLIEPHALRLGATRWLWHPVRSARVMFLATWLGEVKPDKAIKAYEDVMAKPDQNAPVTVPVSLNGSKHAAIETSRR